MLIKCNDKKIIDFDDNLVKFSKTISSIKKYSNDNVISLQFCDSKLLSIINNWLLAKSANMSKKHLILNFSKYKYDSKFFSTYQSKNSKTNLIIQLLKVADFLNIDLLVHSLSVLTSIRFLNFSAIKINNYFDLNKISLNLKEKIFFMICNRRGYLNSVFANINNFDFGNQNILYRSYFDSRYSNMKFLNIGLYSYINDLKQISLNNRTTYDNFKIFDSLNDEYIFFESNEKLLNYILLPNVSLNLNFKKDVFFKYFDINHLNDCFLAGGCFSSYLTNTKLSKKYNDLREILISKQDYDLFFFGFNDNYVFNYYSSKFANFPNFKVCDNGGHYGFKFKTIKVELDGFLVNLIFQQEMHERCLLKCLKQLMKDFDFSLTKIFYSFRLKKTFLMHNLFNLFKTNNKNLLKENDCNFYFKSDLEQFIPNLEKFKLILITNKKNVKSVQKLCDLNFIFNENCTFFRKHSFVVGLIKILDIGDDNRNEFSKFFTFLITRFGRIFKYAIKGCFEQDKCLDLICFCVEIFYLFIHQKFTGSNVEILKETFYECICNFYLA